MSEFIGAPPHLIEGGIEVPTIESIAGALPVSPRPTLAVPHGMTGIVRRDGRPDERYTRWVALTKSDGLAL